MNNILNIITSNIYLTSDFQDYYDSFFDSKETSEIEFKRFSTESLNKHEMFRLMKKIGIKTTPFGKIKYIEEIVSDFYKKYNEKIDENDKLIVYINDKKGIVKEKIILSFYEAIKKYPNEFCSLFIPCKLPENNINNIKHVFHRELHIGNKMFWLRYSSKSFDDFYVEIIKQIDINGSKLSSPLYSIDYIFAQDNNFYAIDFNMSPMIKETGIENVLKPKEIADLIKEQINEKMLILKK